MTKSSGIASITQAEKKRIRSLHTRKGRKSERQFIAEGVRLLEESLHHNWLPDKVYWSDALLADRGKALLKKFEAARVTNEKISVRDLKGISETETSQGILGLFNIPRLNLNTALANSPGILILDNISDPGNVGTLFRSALAFGIKTILLTNNSADPYNSKAVRASAGAIFGLMAMTATIDEIFRLKDCKSHKLIVADIRGDDLNLKRNEMRKPSQYMLVLGSEAMGPSADILSAADVRLMIAHSGDVESLNVAVAGSIIMMELYNMR